MYILQPAFYDNCFCFQPPLDIEQTNKTQDNMTMQEPDTIVFIHTTSLNLKLTDIFVIFMMSRSFQRVKMKCEWLLLLLL